MRNIFSPELTGEGVVKYPNYVGNCLDVTKLERKSFSWEGGREGGEGGREGGRLSPSSGEDRWHHNPQLYTHLLITHNYSTSTGSHSTGQGNHTLLTSAHIRGCSKPSNLLPRYKYNNTTDTLSMQWSGGTTSWPPGKENISYFLGKYVHSYQHLQILIHLACQYWPFKGYTLLSYFAIGIPFPPQKCELSSSPLPFDFWTGKCGTAFLFPRRIIC